MYWHRLTGFQAARTVTNVAQLLTPVLSTAQPLATDLGTFVDESLQKQKQLQQEIYKILKLTAV